VREKILRSRLSRQLYERAKESLVGGVNNTAYSKAPYPTYFAAAEGPYLIDIDGNRHLDLRAGYSALPFGAAPDHIKEAITAQLDKFVFVTGPYLDAVELGEQLCARIPSVEKVIFTDSGTKATNFAVRLARLYTGREKFAKFVGAYHGSWDGAMVGMAIRYGLDPTSLKPAPGSPRSTTDDIVLLPFNDIEGTRKAIAAAADDLGSILVEPVLGDGYIPPLPGYLEMVREECDRYGIVLIFDEMITLSLAPGGAQELYSVTPDLTAMGKVIGGGIPIGAIGGKDEIMVHADRSRGAAVPAGGSTFAGHPLAIAAGLAQLDRLTPAVYERLGVLGDTVRAGIDGIGQRLGVPLHSTGVGQLFGWHWNETPVLDYLDHTHCDHGKLAALTDAMGQRGYLCGTLGRCHLTAVMSDQDVAAFLGAMEGAVQTLLSTASRP
jgi:glutamate-1-semialdehyde 2,1-aminomutase